MAMTYNTLVQQITDYLNTTNAVTLAEIPNFIYLTHQEICRDYVNIGYEQYVNGAFVPNAINGGSVIPKPSRWRRNVSFTFGSGPNFNTSNIVYQRTYEYCRQFCPNPIATVGPPEFYSDYGFEHWLVVPTPDLAYAFQIAYIEMPAPININNQTNWLTNYAPDALLWGSLCKAIPFLKDDERVQMWKAYYKEARESLDIQDKANFYDRASNRSAD
jgi:hypothetical protein